MKLMIVDDHAPTRSLIREMVSFLASEIHECASGAECLERYATARPDIVTLDLQMQPVDGLATLSELKRHHADAHVVIVTQMDNAALRRRAAYLGACAYIDKNELRLLRDYLVHFVPVPRRRRRDELE